MKNKMPSKVVSMIRTRQNKGEDSKKIASYINNTPTVKKLGLEYSHRTVAAVMANITMGTYSISTNQ